MQLWRLRPVCKLETQKRQRCNFVWTWRPENQECQGQEKMDVSAQVIRQERTNASFFHICYIQILSGLGDACPHWGGHQFKSHPETHSQAHSEIMFNLITPWSVKLIYKINCHSHWSTNMQLSDHSDNGWLSLNPDSSPLCGPFQPPGPFSLS